MTTKAQFLFLGTGASLGVPVIGCQCPVCLSESLFNQRLRPSALITIKGKRILVDCGPDLRQQALEHDINAIDALIITHAHNDHTAGADDLRPYNFHRDKPMPCLLSKETAEDMEKRFYYMFDKESTKHQLFPKFEWCYLAGDSGTVMFEDVQIHYLSYMQMGMKVNGFRIGNMAYICDIRTYSPHIFDQLKGVKILVLSALRYTSSAFHFSVDEAVEFSNRVGPDQTWLTHISHDLDHEKTNAYLPSNIQLAYDGMRFEFLA
jgi:phosphoribosyl 1,2-cyclic phosphate phosphodiesterase